MLTGEKQGSVKEVENYFHQLGFKARRDASPNCPDIIAENDEQIFVIELKHYEHRNLLTYDSIADVKSYTKRIRNERGSSSIIPLLIGNFEITDNIKIASKHAGVFLLSVELNARELKSNLDNFLLLHHFFDKPKTSSKYLKPVKPFQKGKSQTK